MRERDHVIIDRPAVFAGQTGTIIWTDGIKAEVRFDRIATSAVFHGYELRVVRPA